MSTADSTAVVIGAGPAGLAAAAQLRRAGFEVIVLDKSAEVGSSWASHYDRLHLHTSRLLSSLPGLVIPRRYGRWVARDDFRAYLASYATHHELSLRLGTTATSIERDATGWAIGWRDATGAGVLSAAVVVIATGYNHSPLMPAWPGLSRYGGRVIHSSEYRNPAKLDAESVLVIGPGNSGAEIAADLAAAGAAVTLAVRTPPNIVRRTVLGIPAQVLVLATSPFPTRIGDRIARLLQIITVGDLSRYGLTKPPRGVFTQAKRDDVIPTIDVGLIDAVRSGSVTVVPAVESFSTNGVTLVNGTVLTPEAVVVATGYQRGLELLLGPLGVIGPTGLPLVNGSDELRDKPGLFFLGYSNPLTGNIRQLGIDARAIARKARRALR
jgi:cation diffusion facilitator CzcD-associated flavoprotein CzcO